MKRLALRRLCSCCLLVGRAAGRAGPGALKLGYVDLQRALMETEDGRKARADLKKVFDQKQKELDEQQTQLKKAMEDLEKKRTLLPADKVREKEAEMQGKLQKVQQTYMRHQQDLQGKEQEATGKIFERMQRIIAKIAVDRELHHDLRSHAGRADLRQAPPGSDQRADPPLQRGRGQGRRRAAGGQAGAPPSPRRPPRSSAPKTLAWDGHPRDRGGAPAPLSVPAGRPCRRASTTTGSSPASWSAGTSRTSRATSPATR